MEKELRSYVMSKVLIGDDGECWGWAGTWSRDRRSTLRFKGKTYVAARLILEMKLGRPVDASKFACHTCDNPSCVNPAHLFEDTPQGNMLDKLRKGRGNNPAGERHHAATLTSEQVAEARRLYAETDITSEALAERYGISRRGMDRILSGEDRKFEGGPLKALGEYKRASGHRNGNCRLDENKVRDIRELYVIGKSMEELGRMYQISPSTVSQIVKGRTWKAAEGPIVQKEKQ